MTVLIRQGRRRCDGVCHNARGPKCRCICEGKNHGGIKDNRDEPLFSREATMNRSDYAIVRDLPGEPLVILDRDLGNKSVTNDAENVVADLVREGKLPEGRRLLYYDSEGQLDEIMVSGGKFAGFKAGPRG